MRAVMIVSSCSCNWLGRFVRTPLPPVKVAKIPVLLQGWQHVRDCEPPM